MITARLIFLTTPELPLLLAGSELEPGEVVVEGNKLEWLFVLVPPRVPVFNGLPVASGSPRLHNGGQQKQDPSL